MSVVPNYASGKYWDERYAASDGSSFDWYQDWDSLRAHLMPFLRRSEDFEIFIPGCGSSELGAKLYESGYTNVSCVDISPVVISWLRTRYGGYSQLEFAVMDVTSPGPDLEPGMFDLVVDKALLDALLCSDDRAPARRMVEHLHSALRPDGHYLVLSHAPPSRRLPALCTDKTAGWVEAMEAGMDDGGGGGEGESGIVASTAPPLPWKSVRCIQIPKPRLDGRPPDLKKPSTEVHYLYVLRK